MPINVDPRPRSVRASLDSMAEVERLAHELEEVLTSHRRRLQGAVEVVGRVKGMSASRAKETDQKVDHRFRDMALAAGLIASQAKTQQLELQDLPASSEWPEVSR